MESIADDIVFVNWDIVCEKHPRHFVCTPVFKGDLYFPLVKGIDIAKTVTGDFGFNRLHIHQKISPIILRNIFYIYRIIYRIWANRDSTQLIAIGANT